MSAIPFNATALAGLTVCVTGAISEVGTRAAVHRLINAAGGLVSDGVNSGVDLLVLGDKPGKRKIQAASRADIKTIEAKEFLTLLGTVDVVDIEHSRPSPAQKEPTPEHYGDW